MMGGRSVFVQCVEYSNRSTMGVGGMQECDAMDGEGTRISLQRSEMMQIRLSEPIGMKKMMSMTSKDPEDCAVPAGRMGREHSTI